MLQHTYPHSHISVKELIENKWKSLDLQHIVFILQNINLEITNILIYLYVADYLPPVNRQCITKEVSLFSN